MNPKSYVYIELGGAVLLLACSSFSGIAGNIAGGVLSLMAWLLVNFIFLRYQTREPRTVAGFARHGMALEAANPVALVAGNTALFGGGFNLLIALIRYVFS